MTTNEPAAEDLEVPLAARRATLAHIDFHPRLGSMLAKAERIERLARELGLMLMLPEPTLMAAASGAHLAKCDRAMRAVAEHPERAGDVGAEIAEAQGVSPEVADVIREHVMPRGPSDPTPPSDAGALVAIADRLDTLAGFVGIGLAPAGTGDPDGLRRAAADVVRTLRDRDLRLRLSDAFRAAFDGYANVELDLGRDAVVAALAELF